MHIYILKQHFAAMGARVRIREAKAWQAGLTVAIGSDRHGQLFDITVNPTERTELRMLDMRPEQRRLLLAVDQWAVPERVQPDVSQTLFCGHDECGWFVWSVPPWVDATSFDQVAEAYRYLNGRTRSWQWQDSGTTREPAMA